MIYVDKLPFMGVQSIIDIILSRIQKEVLLRHPGDLNVGTTTHFLGRNTSRLNSSNVDILQEQSGVSTITRSVTHERRSRR